MTDWRETTIGEVAEVVGGGTPSTKEASYWGGDVLWLTPGELTKREGQVITSTERTITADGLVKSSAKVLPKDTVLLTSRATVGAVGLAGQPMTTNQGFQSLIAREWVLPRFLMYWVQSNRAEFESRASGSTFPEISGKKVKAIPLTLPPLGEQARIVAIVEAIDRTIETLADETAAALDLIVGLLRMEPFAGEDWPRLPFPEVIEFREGPGIMARDFRGDGTPLIRLAGLTPGAPILTGCNYLDPEKVASKWAHFRVSEGDVLLSTSAALGRVAVVDAESVGAIPYTGIIRMRPASEHVLAEYIPWLLRSADFAAQVAEAGVGTVMAHFGPSHLKRMTIGLPPIHIQRQILGVLGSVWNHHQSLASELAAARKARLAVLSALLSREIEADEAVDRFIKSEPSDTGAA